MNTVPVVDIDSTPAQLSTGMAWVRYLNDRANELGFSTVQQAAANLDARAILGIDQESDSKKKKSDADSYREFQHKIDSIEEAVKRYLDTMRVRNNLPLVQNADDALEVIDILKRRYNTQEKWGAYRNANAAYASAVDHISKVSNYGTKADSDDRLDFVTGRDNPLAVLGLKSSSTELRTELATPQSRKALFEHIAAMAEEQKNAWGRIKAQMPTNSPELAKLDRLIVRADYAAQEILSNPRGLVARLEQFEQRAEDLGLEQNMNLNVETGYWTALQILDLKPRMNGRPVSLADVRQAVTRKQQEIEDLRTVNHGNPSQAKIAIDSWETKIKKAAEVLGITASSTSGHEILRTYIKSQTKRTNDMVDELSRRIGLANNPALEFGAYAALGCIRTPDAFNMPIRLEQYRKDLSFLNNPINQEVTDPRLCQTLATSLTQYFNQAVEQQAPGQYVLSSNYIAEENLKKSLRIDADVTRTLNVTMRKIRALFENLPFLSDPRQIAQVGKALIWGGFVVSGAVLIGSFGGGLLPLFGGLGPVGGLLGIGISLTLPPYLISFKGPRWLAETGIRRYFELQQRFLGNKFLNLSQKVKEPEEYFPVYEDYTLTLLLYQRKIPEDRIKLILHEYFSAKPLFEQVTKADERDPFENDRDNALLRVKTAILGIETMRTRQNGEEAVTPSEFQKIEDAEARIQFPTNVIDPATGLPYRRKTFRQKLIDRGFAALVNPRLAEQAHNKIRWYYPPALIREFYTDKRGYCVNEDIFTFFHTGLKLNKIASTLHGRQSVEEKMQTLSNMRTESGESAKIFNGFPTSESGAIDSIGKKLLMAEDELPIGLYGGQNFLEFLRSLDEEKSPMGAAA